MPASTNDEVLSPTIDVPSDVNEEPPASEQCVPVPPAVAAKTVTNSNKSFSSHKILLLFSGPPRPATSMQHYLLKLGVLSEAFDITLGQQYNLVDDSVWRPLVAKLHAGEYSALFASPPCGTFSRVRSRPGGPPPLRGLQGRDRYGLSKLTYKQSEEVRTHNLLAVRTAEAAHVCINIGIPFIVEQPALRDGEISMYRMDEYVRLMSVSGVGHTISPQCSFGANARKLTSWIYHGLDLSDLPQTCMHLPRTWHAKDGEQFVGRHPPSFGSKVFCKSREEAGQLAASNEFVTSKLSAYPDLLNRYLSAKLASVCLRGQSGDIAAATTGPARHAWQDRLGKERVEVGVHLKGTPSPDIKSQEEQMAIGGLRDATKSVSRLHQEATLGRAIGIDIMALLSANPSWITQIIDSIGNEKAVHAPHEAVESVRRIIARHCNYDLDATHPTSRDEGCSTDIDANLLGAWQKAANDPDTAVCQWLLHGAPASLKVQPEHCGIFPAVHDTPDCLIDELATEYDGFSNYTGVDEDDTASMEFEKHLDLKRLRAFDTIEETQSHTQYFAMSLSSRLLSLTP